MVSMSSPADPCPAGSPSGEPGDGAFAYRGFHVLIVLGSGSPALGLIFDPLPRPRIVHRLECNGGRKELVRRAWEVIDALPAYEADQAARWLSSL